MSLQIAAVANSIAALSVTGLVIKDVDEIPARVDPRSSTLIPLPDFVSNFTMGRDSFGGGSTALMTVTYQLNYRLLYTQPGKGRTKTIENYDNMVALVAAFLDAVLAVDVMTGAIDIVPMAIYNMGVVNDPAENAYIGCDLTLLVSEFVN